jgi:hypothetical protein
MSVAKQTGGTTQVMNNFLTKFFILMGLIMAPVAYSEDVSESLLLQFSKGDLATIEKAVQDTFDVEPVQGESSVPVSSPYAFGTITARGIDYSFMPQIHETTLLHGGIQFKLSLRGFHGLIRRLEMNSSGSQACTNIRILSPRNVIPVSVLVRPTVTPTGDVQLEVSESRIDLNNDNFEVSPVSGKM